jgi:hypothetical protein
MFRLCFRSEPQSSSELSVLPQLRFLASWPRVQFYYCRASRFLPLSLSFAAATSSDAPAVITLNSNNHVAHPLLPTGQPQVLTSVVIKLLLRTDRGRRRWRPLCRLTCGLMTARASSATAAAAASATLTTGAGITVTVTA